MTSLGAAAGFLLLFFSCAGKLSLLYIYICMYLLVVSKLMEENKLWNFSCL